MAAVYDTAPSSNTPTFRLIKDEEAPPYDGQRRPERVRLTVIEKDTARAVCRDCGTAASMYLLLETYADPNGDCTPSYDTLAEGLNVSRRQAIRYVQQLEQAGYVAIHQRVDGAKGFLSNRFNLPFHRKNPVTPLVTPAHPPGDNPSDRGSAPVSPKVVISSSEVVDVKTPLPPEGEDAPKEKPKKPRKKPEGWLPYSLLEVFCEELGQDPLALSDLARNKQLAAAKRLIREGLTEDETRRLARWLSTQSWINGGIDLILAEKQLGKWQLAGMPDRATVHRNGHAPTSTVGRSLENARRAMVSLGIDPSNPTGSADDAAIEVRGVERR